MTSINKIIAEVAVAANADDQGDNPEAHAALLNGIQRLQLAVEKPIETAKRILYQVRLLPKLLILPGIQLLITVWATSAASQRCSSRRGRIGTN